MLYKLVAKDLLGKKGFEMLDKLLDRAYGRPNQTTELSGEIGIKAVTLTKEKIREINNILENEC
jgi:hypothetical protein